MRCTTPYTAWADRDMARSVLQEGAWRSFAQLRPATPSTFYTVARGTIFMEADQFFAGTYAWDVHLTYR